MSFLEILPIALLGAVCGLDVVSFPQAMVSRPLVAATLAGWLAGDAAAGLLIGATLELFALETLPFGASRYPEWGSAAVVGGTLFASHTGSSSAAMVVGVLGALATASVGGWSMVVIRRLNARWARRSRPGLDAGSRGTVNGLQMAGLTADFLRGGLLTLMALLVLSAVADASLALWSIDGRLSRAIVAGLAGIVATGATWKIFHSTTGTRWFLAGGLAIGLLLLAIR